jgi:putative intracellular protease/amidase
VDDLTVAVLLYDRLTALDAIGPYEVLSRVPGATVTFVAERPGPITVDTGRLALVADTPFADLPAPDVLLVPGGPGDVAERAGAAAQEWVRAAHKTTRWTTSVCTGSLILGAAGVLAGKRATTHWNSLDLLGDLGAVPVAERVVVDGRIVTAAGVSAGIDMALTLAARIAGDAFAQAIQLGIEYDPQPPFATGSPATAPPELVEAVRDHLAGRRVSA